MVKKQRYVILLAVIGTLALGLYGCGKISPTGPQDDGLMAPPVQPPKSALPAEVLWPKMIVNCDTLYVEAKIYEDHWNSVDLPLLGDYNRFVVPEDGVEDDVTITIAIVRNTYWDEETDRWSYMAEFDFGPDGLEFDEDDRARLYLDAEWLDLDGGKVAVLRYYNGATGLWEEISSTKVRWGRLKFYFEHFSKYAISG